ncbi:MMPL family transporter [Streptomyces sp. NPDC048527]|uniref:MMPL family transporter n=1 Tax=Streptomyces sp. NPDC048527 TaxID=3365568 RepID=UPI003722FA32
MRLIHPFHPRCGAVRCGAVRCGAVRCGAVRCGAVRCGAVRLRSSGPSPVASCLLVDPAPYREAVARGLGGTGRLVTAAALLLALVFAAFVTSGVMDLKLFGFGLVFAVLLDATLVRGIRVPALATLAGRWNWWAPAPLAPLHQRIGVTEHGLEEKPAPARSRTARKHLR